MSCKHLIIEIHSTSSTKPKLLQKVLMNMAEGELSNYTNL